MGGPHNWEGRVEIFWNGTWGTISDTDWGTSEAQVVCKQLGLPSNSKEYFVNKSLTTLFIFADAVPYSCCSYGQGSGIISITSVTCSGSETSIIGCLFYTLVSSSHENDVGVKCEEG